MNIFSRIPNKFGKHAGQLSTQTNLIFQLWHCFLYGDLAPSIGIHIKLNQIQTRTNLGPQWKKWCQIQNLLGILLKLFGKAK